VKRVIFVLLIICLIACSGLGIDKEAYKIRKFLETKYSDSPLIGYEEDIIQCAEKFNLDYRLYIAIAGCESTFGRRYLKWTNNLTGYGIYGKKITRFSSIYHNIYETHKLISTSNYYRKYRKTREIADLVYVYKGVPPFDFYVRNLRLFMRQIDEIKIEDEL